ncbi:EndoU domain-containing protein [Flavobacterium columnare]|uniref:EndoU domain-containing protein n=1 Tax=Flavobacterium columnare TaxID=996 RepID=UPI00107E8114|nr:EndoU domain-containing protein [Flavobacterium columnare]MCH4832596.1 EndoU domain-containing protein [Flavobacterium columnare]
MTDTKTPEQKKTEIATYVHDLPGKQIALWIDFDAQGKASIKTFLGKEIKGRDAEGTGIYIKYLSDVLATLDLPELKFNPLTALLDGLAGLIEEAKIPERFYNPDHEQYNPLPSMVYSLASLSIINDEMDKFMNSGNTDVVKYSQSRQQFALLCGVWNGFVELVAGVPQGLSLVVKADEGLMNLITNKDNARAKLKEAFDKFSWSALGNMIDEEWKKATANPCMVSHLSGKVVFVVASCFIGAGEANIASKFLQTVERLDVIGQAMGKFAKLSSPIVKAAFNKAGKLKILPLAKLEPQFSIRLRTLFRENVRQLLNRTSDQVALSLHALDNGNFLWDNFEVSPEELAEILAKKLDPNKKEIVLLSCNDLASAQALAQATGKKVYTTDGAITIFENGIKRADNTKWYEVSSDGTAIERFSPPIKECSTCTGDGVEMGVSTAGRHPNWVEVLDIRNKILAKKAHVLEVEGLDKVRNYNGTTMEGFTGCHSDQALRDYVATNGGTYRINGKPTNLQADEVFEGQPIITINGKEYVKTNGQPIVEYSNGKYGGTSTFFPENWNNSKILDEVEYAIANNHGVAPGNNPSEYFGFSRDGKVEIHFYLNTDGTIGSYFPKKR